MGPEKGIYLCIFQRSSLVETSLYHFTSHRIFNQKISISRSSSNHFLPKYIHFNQIRLCHSSLIPSHQYEMPSIIQSALIFETFVNLPPAAMLILAPSWTLGKLLPTTSTLTGIPASTITLAQMFGALIVALTVPVAMSIQDRPNIVEARRMTYWLLGAGEACLIPLLFLKEGSSGFQDGILRTGAIQMTPFLVWRAIVLLAKPEWFAGTFATEKKRQ